VARKVAANNPTERRSGVNRAQLKALAARQAMTNIPTRTGDRVAAEEETAPALDLRGVALSRRRIVLTRDQEYEYIRADLVRLLVVGTVLLAALVAIAIVLR
jgi:hypothetical protein